MSESFMSSYTPLSANWWDINSKDAVDLTTTEKEWTEYREMNVDGVKGLPKFEIETRDKDSFILPSEAYLEVRFRITQADGVTAIPSTDIISLENCGLSLFKSIEYMIEDQRIEYSDYPAIGAIVKNITNFSKQFSDTIASNQWWYPDTKKTPGIYSSSIVFRNLTVPGDVTLTVNANGQAAVAGAVDGNTIGATWNGSPVTFAFTALANGQFGAPTVVVPLMNGGVLSLPAAVGADNDYLIGLVGGTYIFFYSGNVQVFPQRDGDNGAIRPINGCGSNGRPLTAVCPDEYIESFNRGFLTRSKKCSLSQYNTIYIPFKDMFGFCNAYNRVSRGLRHRLNLQKNDDNDMLVRASETDRRIIIDYISAWIPRLKPNLETLTKIEAMLTSNETVEVGFLDTTVWRTGNEQNALANNAAIQLATIAKKPVRVWVVFQAGTRTGQAACKRVFDTVGITNIQVRLNGKIFPMYEYRFTDSVTTDPTFRLNRAYQALMHAGMKHLDRDEGSLLTLDLFKQVYPIFYFDLTHQEEDLYKANKYAELEVRYTTSNATGSHAAHHMFVIYESERVIKFKLVSGSLALQV